MGNRLKKVRYVSKGRPFIGAYVNGRVDDEKPDIKQCVSAN